MSRRDESHPLRLISLVPGQTTAQVLQLKEEGVDFIVESKPLHNRDIRTVLHEAQDPSSADDALVVPPIMLRTLSATEREARESWNPAALQLRDHVTNRIDQYITLHFFPDDIVPGPNGTASIFMPFHYRPAGELVLLSKLDMEAWEVMQKRDKDSTGDLPAEAGTAAIDQPSYEVVEIGKIIVGEMVALQAAASRRDPQKMKEVLARTSSHLRGAKALVHVLERALTWIE